jgi:hypothetical protein
MSAVVGRRGFCCRLWRVAYSSPLSAWDFQPRIMILLRNTTREGEQRETNKPQISLIASNPQAFSKS